ncbi:MAG: hypothetical protein LIO85_06535 [Rikenellaceae bacterium]|nr:hypothetical protein [Rikenellaceae bacterium]
MENKLQELTQKLYDEGLAKGRQQADSLVAEACESAEKILSEARYEADRIRKQARTEADDLHKNTLTELSLAGKQAVAQLKGSISDLIVEKSLGGSVKDATLDAQFIKDILVSVASNWNNSATGSVTLQALLPEADLQKLDKALAASSAGLLDKGLEVGYSDEVKTGFKIGPKDGGYYISFTDESFNALLREYLRPKVRELLFGNDR